VGRWVLSLPHRLRYLVDHVLPDVPVRQPADETLYQIVRDHFETFRAQAASLRDGEGLPRFVDQEFRDFLRCGWLAGGFARRTPACASCRGRPRRSPGANPDVPLANVPGESAGQADTHEAAHRPGRCYASAELMRRTFGVDVLACPRCGGRLRLIALVEEAAVIDRILRHLGLPTTIPTPTSPGAAAPGGGFRRLAMDRRPTSVRRVFLTSGRLRRWIVRRRAGGVARAAELARCFLISS
jgi:hypothetical protein